MMTKVRRKKKTVRVVAVADNKKQLKLSYF